MRIFLIGILFDSNVEMSNFHFITQFLRSDSLKTKERVGMLENIYRVFEYFLHCGIMFAC